MQPLVAELTGHNGGYATAAYAKITAVKEVIHMNIADRIQHLRKAKGISQEELADKIGVSRQAVSKWKSEQSTPDIDKIILLSDYFETTTDYLIKGIEPTEENKPTAEHKEKPNALIFTLAGTILNAVGLIAAFAIELTKQTPLSLVIGFIILIMGTGIFKAGQIINSDKKRQARNLFAAVNIWLLMFIPLSQIANIIAGVTRGFSPSISPFPEIGSTFTALILFFVMYLPICIITDIIVWVKSKKHEQ